LPLATEQLRVLIVRLGAMGDILHALPAVTALRQAHPQWFLGWAVEPRWQPLFRDSQGTMPLVDCIHLASARQWARAPFSPTTIAEIRALRREIRAQRYDVSIDMQGAVRSALLARMASTPRIVGEDCPREHAARWLFRERIPAQGAHVIEQAMEVANAIAGENLQPVPPLLPSDPESEAWAQKLLQSEPGGGNRHLVLLSPGAGWGAKRWPPERYGEVAAQLQAAGWRVLVNAGPGEKQIAAAVVAASQGAAETPEFTLPRLIAVTRHARLFVAGDTGPLHLACALGVPVVGIYGPTDPRRNGPFGVPFRVLRHPESKRDHTRSAEPEAGLLTITPAQVFAAAMELLGDGA
jgi:heptosyltransferase-1